MPVSSTAEDHDIDALRARNPDAFERLVHNESHRLYNFIFRMLRDEEETRGLVQETFLQALLSVDTFRGEARFSTWLYGIALNLSRAFLRKSKRRFHVYSEAQLDRLQPRFDVHGRYVAAYTPWNPEAVTEQNERARIVRGAINRLPEDFQMVVILRDLEQLSTREAAHLLHISETNVRVRLHRARNALRTLLEPHFRADQRDDVKKAC